MGAGNLVSEEDPGGHPGEDHDEEGQELEVASQDAGPLGVTHVLAGQCSLDNHLVTAPVPDARDGQTEDHPGPGQVRLARHGGPWYSEFNTFSKPEYIWYSVAIYYS